VILSIEEGYRLPAPMGCPVALHQLMLHCWQKERNHRPKFVDVVPPESPCEVMEYPMFVSIGDWLDSIKMSQYKSNFMTAGVCTLDSAASMSIEDIRHFGVELIGHQRRIASSIQSLRLQLLHEHEQGFHVCLSVSDNPERSLRLFRGAGPPSATCGGGPSHVEALLVFV
ncbi:hypothetical protein CRUP_031548, partial [Coryphaenoides rupestris]